MTHITRNATWPFTLAVAALLLAGCGPGTASSPAAAGTTASAAPATVPPGYHRQCKMGQALDKCPAVKDEPPASVPPPPPSTPVKPAPAVKPPTVAQQQALVAAQQYVDFGPFSRTGLTKQLASEYGNGFSKADAAWAVDHVHANWNAEAVEAARAYLEMDGFSRASLTKQLTSKYGDGFTKAQAAYAVKKVGL